MSRYYELDVICEVFSDILHISEREIEEILDKAPTEDVVPRSEVEEWYAEYHKVKEDLKQEKMYHKATEKLADRYLIELNQAKQEVAKGTVEIIQAHLNMLFVALQNEKTEATVEKLIEINSKIAILESIQLALGDVKKKYIGE